MLTMQYVLSHTHPAILTAASQTKPLLVLIWPWWTELHTFAPFVTSFITTSIPAAQAVSPIWSSICQWQCIDLTHCIYSGVPGAYIFIYKPPALFFFFEILMHVCLLIEIKCSKFSYIAFPIIHLILVYWTNKAHQTYCKYVADIYSVNWLQDIWPHRPLSTAYKTVFLYMQLKCLRGWNVCI